MFLPGVLHGFIIFALGFALAVLLNQLGYGEAGEIAWMLIYYLGHGYLGYRYKAKNGVLFKIVAGDKDQNRVFIRYAVGVGLWFGLFAYANSVQGLIGLPWWSVMAILFLPLALVSGGVGSAAFMFIGSWFKRPAT